MILYVSDLDGTLANSREQLSRETVRIINELLDEGMAFTIATARSMASAAEIIAPLRLRLPIIYNNGVFIYHPLEKKNISAWFMNTATVNRLLDDCRRHGISPLLYVQDEEGKMSVFYRGVFHPGEEQYIGGRLAKGDRRFVLVDDFQTVPGERVHTFLVIGDDTDLADLHSRWRQYPEIAVHYVQDIYSGAYWLEVTDRRGTKKEAVCFLRHYLQAAKVICFGDQLNDLSMFEAADEAYAVKNAHELLKSKATGIIGDHNEDGVARFLLRQRRSGGNREGVK